MNQTIITSNNMTQYSDARQQGNTSALHTSQFSCLSQQSHPWRTLHTSVHHIFTTLLLLFAVGVGEVWGENVLLTHTVNTTDNKRTELGPDVINVTGGSVTYNIAGTNAQATSNAVYLEETVTGNNNYIYNFGTSNGYVKVSLTEGFKKGDIITVSGICNNSGFASRGFIVSTASGSSPTNGINTSNYGANKTKDNLTATLDANYEGKTDIYILRNGASYFCGVTVTRPDPTAEKSTDATLSDLKVYGIKIDGFAAATETYNVTLAYGTTDVPTVTATCADSGAKAVVTQASALPGTATVVVTAEDETTTKTYTVNLSVSSTEPTIPTGYDAFYRAEDWDKMTASSSLLTVNDVSIYNVAVDASGELTADGIGTVTKRFNFGGAGGTGETNRRIEVPITGPCTVTIFGSNGNVGRSVTISDATNSTTVCETTADNKGTLISESYEYTGTAKKLYLYSTTSGYYIYGFGIKYASTDPTFEPYSIDLTAETSAQNTPDGWTAVTLPSITVNKEVTLSDLSDSGDNAAKIQAAIDAANTAGGGKVIIPAGTWLSGPIQMKSNVVLHLSAGCTLKMLSFAGLNTANTAMQWPMGTWTPEEKDGKTIYNSTTTNFIYATSVANNVIIEGEGETSIIEGQGGPWWDAREVNGDYSRPNVIRLEKGSNHLYRNFKIQNAPAQCLVIGRNTSSDHVSNVTVHDVIISNPASDAADPSHNTDGIPVWSPYVNIYDCNISTGDDNIVCDDNAQFVHAWNITCGKGHGMSIGSNTKNLHDIIYEDITFTGTDAGFRIKTNSDRSGNDKAGTDTNGAVKNIICRNATMTGVPGPIKITSWYDDDAQDPSTVSTPSAITATTPEFCNITFQNITADAVEGKTSWKHNSPIYIYGRPEMKIHDITFDNVQIASKRGMYLAYCEGINFINGCKITNTTNAENFIDVEHEATVTGNYGQPKPVTWAAPATAPEAGATLVDNDELNVVTVYATTAETNYGHKYDDFSFDNTIQVRVNAAPTADNLTGTEKTTCTPLVITAKKDGKLTVYYRRQTDNGTTDGTAYTAGNSKDILLVDQAAPTTKITGRLIGGSAANNDYVKQTYNLTADHVYTLYATGTTIRVNGFNYDTSSTATITYYDADGTSIDTDEVDKGSALAFKDGAESKVTVAAGKKFRNWRIGSQNGEKAVEGTEVTDDLDLYAYVTDEEKVDEQHTYDFTSFDIREHDVITAVNNCTTDPTHGLGMTDGNSEVIFTVAGKTSIKLKKCSSAATDAKFVIKKKSSASASQRGVVRRATAGDVLSDDIPAYSATDGEEVTYEYTGDAADLIITCDAQAYLHSLELTPAAAPAPTDIVLYDLKTSVGSAEVTAADATVTEATSLVLSNTAGRIKITPKDGEKFKNGDKVDFSGTIGNTSRDYGLKFFAADGTTSAGELKVAGTTSPLKVSGTLTLGADADYIFIGRSGGTTTTMTEMTITRAGTTPDPDPTPTVEFEPFKIDFRVKASEEQKYTVTLPDDGVLPECVTVTNVAWHGNQHGATNGTSLTVHVDGPTKFTIGGCNFGNTVSVKVGSADAVAVNNKTATCDNGGDAIAGLTYNNNVTYNYEGTEVADITFSLGSNAYMPYLFAEAITKDWTPTWNPTAERWEVKTGETDAENGESFIAALDYVKSQTNKTLYIPNGTYDLGETTEETIVKVEAGMHLIGESQDGVVIKNQPKYEGIGITATLKINGANVTLENMTLKCRAPYGKTWGKNKDTGIYEEQSSSAERGVCVQDCGNGSHYINVTLDGLQDTYYSNGTAGMTATFDNCIVRGNVDFFCGSGDITVNNSQLQIVTTHTSGGTAIICAPATYTTETQGYLFNNCIVEAATSEVGCLVSGHSNNLKFNLARAWYNGTDGKDKTPRVTFKDTEFEIAQAADWGNSIGTAQTEERRIFQIINTGVQFSHEAQVIDKTNKPFAYATANDRTNPASVSPSNITGGGEYDLEKIMELMGTEGIDYTVGTTKTINGHKAIVLKSANTTENDREKRVAMDQTIIDAINNNDIIVLDGAGYSDFVVKSVMTFRKVENKTVVGINGARLCTEWYLTDYFKSILENVPTSSGTGVNSASTAEGTGGPLYDKDCKLIENIKEEGEFLTRKNLYEAVGNEDYRYSGIFYLGACKNWIIRNLKLVGPGSLDCAGYDLMAIIDSDNGTKFSDHMWVDHCEFIDGMDGNFDITNGSDFVTVSWCKFYYTDRSYAHQNTNLVGSSDDKGDMDRGKLNITFAYNEWGANCRARMPMARYGRIHMLNNYYNCAGNSEYAMNPRKESEFLIQGNYWEKGVRRAYNPSGQTAITWDSSNYYADKAAANAGASTGTTVTVPYQYSALILDPHKVPEVITLNGGAKLYQKPYFTTNLGVADNTPGTPELQYNAELTEELKADGLVFSVWAENAHTFQWFRQDVALDGTTGEWEMLEGENRNTYTFKPVTGVEFNLKCQAFGVSGETTSDVLKVKIDGLSAPYYLGGMPTEMQTVYTGSPMTFTANFKDATGYQWYKATSADRAGATAIDGATSNTYTYDPTTAEIFYLYCAASNSNGKGDGYSDVVKVKGIYHDVKFHYAVDTVENETMEGGTGGLATVTKTPADDECSAVLQTSKSSGDPVISTGGLRFAIPADHAVGHINVAFTNDNAFTADDKLYLKIGTTATSGPANNYGFYISSSSSVDDKFAEYKIPTNTETGRKEPYEITVDLPAQLVGKHTFYLIPICPAGKNVNLHEIKVLAPDEIPADAPTIIVDLNSEYETRVGRELSATIQVEDASTYQWYKNTTNEAVLDEAHKISGQTSATLSYTPVDSDEGKIYIYCYVTGTKAGSHVTTKVAEVTVLEASNGESGTAKLMWPMVDSDSKNTLAPNAIIVTGDIKNASDVFSACNNATLGSMLTNGSTKPGKFTDVTEPYAQTIPNTGSASTHLTPGTNAAVNPNAYIAYSFTPSVTFKPTNISFKVAVSGTGNGAAQPVLQYGAGASDKIVLADVFTPVRESNNVAQVISSYPISDISIEAGTVATFYIYAGGKIGSDKSFCVRDVIIEGDYIKEIITKCANPTVTKGAYDGATQKWTYTLACSTPNSKINYKIGDGEAQLNQNNPAQITIGYDQSFSVWATDTETDPEKKLKDSKIITFTADAQPVLKNPTYTVSTYNTATKKFTVEIAAEDETTILYSVNGGDEQTYSEALQLNPADVISAKATRTGYVTSGEAKATMLVPEWPGTEQTLKANGTTNNIGVSYTVGSTWVAGSANNLSDGLKLRTNSNVTKSDASELKNAFRIAVHPGFVIKKIDVTIQSNNESGTHTLDGIFVDEAAESITPSVALPLALPMTKATPSTTTFTIDNIRAKESIDFAFTDGAVSSKQVNAMFTIYYEFIDDLASVTIDDEPLADDKLATLKSTQAIVLDGEFPEDPVVKMTSVLGYEYIIKAGDVDDDKNTIFAKSFYNEDSEDKNYVIKANVNAVKSPNIEIASDMSLKGGYKVTLKYIEDQEVRTVPYIKIGDGEWEAYDPAKEYYTLGTVQSKMKYGAELESETVARSASCPSNSYEAGKPFAVFIYVNGYSDNQTGVTAYNNESLAKDQIYQAIKRQFNVVDLPVNNSDAILDKRPDITDAKLVVITESLGGSGSVEIAGVGNKSNMMALTIKRDVLDKTNVLNLKMFLNGSSSANNQRWQWAQPRAMASELTSIVPLAPADGGMYEVFSTTTMSRDGSINLWDDVDTENLLYHLQPVFNFNEENETRPTFTPLALVIDPEEPDDQREEYHALHFYKKGDYQYAAFGLSLNEWPKYNDNVGAIVEKIGEMIIAGRDLDSPLEGIVKPVITDNGDGSAKVMNNNINAETFYKVYTEEDFQALAAANPDKGVTEYVTAQDLIAANQQPDDEYCTPKYINDMHIFAVSRLGGALSEVVHDIIKGNTLRYVIRDNDDAAAVGLVAKYPFDVNDDGSAKTFKMPYNQSWKKDGYTVTSWEVIKSRDASYPVGAVLTPGQNVDGLTQDITVKAVWSENTHKITDISSSESDKAMRTVTWEFLQSKGAPALAMEKTAGNMQAVLVGQVKFADGKWLDVPMTINTDHLATLPDNGTEYHGKFNNTSTNWAKELKDGETVLYTGTDYTQVRTGTQFTFPVIYGSNIVYKQVDLVEGANGVANGNVNRSQISQSYLTDGSKTGNDLNYWRIVNPGYELTPGFSGMYLQPNCTVVMTDGVAQLAKTSPLYEMYKTSMGAMGYDSQLYDADADGNETGGNANYGGLIYYDGEATEATMTSVESANYVHVGADTGKALGALNYGSVFMQSLSITYPVLHSLEYEVVPEMSALEGANEPAAVATVITDSHKNTGGKYLANENVEIIVAPSYGYYISKESSVWDQYTQAEADAENTDHLIKDRNGRTPGDQGYIPTYEIDYTPKKAGDKKTTKYVFLKKNGVTVTDGITYDGEGIPSEGAKVRLRLDGGKLVFKLLKHPTYKYNAYAEPGLYGNVYFNTNTGRTSEQEYNEFAAGKHIIMSATPKTGYRFVRWENKKGEKFIPKATWDATAESARNGLTPFAGTVVQGDGKAKNPFAPERNLADNELDITVAADNALPTVPEYIAIFEKAKEGTAHYLFSNALLQTDTKDADGKVTATTYSKLDITDAERRAFPDEFKSTALNVPSYYTIFKEGYTLDRWVEKKADPAFDADKVLTNDALGAPYYIGNYYYYNTENEHRYLIPVFKKNEQSYDYRATTMDITWDFRSSHYAQRVNLPTSDMEPGEVTYYSTHATFNDNITVDVPLQISFEGSGRFVNNVIDDWAAFGEGTKITIPSGVGAKFTLATYAPLNAEPGMGGTNFDGVVPTEYTVREENGMPVYYYTYVTPSTETTVTLTIGSDYTYYKYLRAQLPSADAVTLYLVSATPEFGDVKLLNVTSTKNEDITADATKVKRVEGLTFNGEPCQAYTLPLGSHVKVQADRKHYYVIDHIDDLHGEEYPAANVHAPTSADKAIGASADDSNLVLDFDIMAYENAVVTYYKLNTLYQVNYTSGQEAEGEAPGMMLIESGESFTIPAVNHHLYVDGQTLRYWVDEDGNKYDLGQTYTLGQKFTASKDLPSGITSGKGFTVPEKDLFLSPYFAVNDFTVMNLGNAATASWPLSRLGSTGTPSYEGNGDIVINYEGINGIYVTQLQVKDSGGNVIDFIDLKMDIRGENGKANNVNSTDRCQINTGTVFGMPSSSNCSFTLKSANNDITVKVDGGTDITGKSTVTSNYTGDKTQVDISFTGNTYLYEVVAQYNPVTTELPELDYATVGNISLGAIGTPLASHKLSTLKANGIITGVPADLSNSTTGIMPVVRGTATRGGYVEVSQATIDNPVATMLVKTRDGVTVSVYKIGFKITYPNTAPRVTDLKVDRKFQCDLQKMYENAITDSRVDGTNYINDPVYLKHLGGDNAANERVGINGVINIKFSTKMAAVTLPATTFEAQNGKATLTQELTALEGQTLTFTYWGLDVDTEYDFIIPAGTLKDVFWADADNDKKAIHIYNEPIRFHFTTVENPISNEHRVVNFVVTHNQASHFDAAQAKMVKDGEKVQIASDELIANLVAKDIPHGTIDEGVALANAYTEAGKRFYIFVPDGEYQLMGNEAIKSISSDPIGEDGKALTLGTKTNVYNGITAISHDNVSITGQSQEKTIVYNHPAFEGLSYASTLKLNNGIANFYAQDLTLQNRFDFLRCRKVSSKGVAPTLWDRSQKAIFKNVKFDSYQDTYYTNANNQLDDTRGYAEDCTIMGYVDFICGDGDHWFQNCDMVVRQGVGSTATNMFAPRQYDTQQWGFVMNQCTFSAENSSAYDVNNGKMTIARPWANSPAEALIECTYNVLSTDDGYKKMTGDHLVLRMHEYMSKAADGTPLDLSKRSLRNSSPGIGSYDAVMTPSKAKEYNLFDVMGGEDGYDPTLYTAQADAPKASQDDQNLKWDAVDNALCYFVFIGENEADSLNSRLIDVVSPTDALEWNIYAQKYRGKYFFVRAANQRGGLGPYSNGVTYVDLGEYDLKMGSIKYSYGTDQDTMAGYSWSTICLPFGAAVPKGSLDDPAHPENINTANKIYVYAVTEVNGTAVHLKKVEHLDAYVGYVVYSVENKNYRFFGSTYPSEADSKLNGYAPDYVANKAGILEPSTVELNRITANVNCYTLAYKDQYGIGFYKFTGEKLKPYRAWLDASDVPASVNDAAAQGNAAKGSLHFVFDDDDDNPFEADAIRGVYDDSERDPLLGIDLNDPDTRIYDLQGQRIRPDLMRRGMVYIINGVKVQWR